MSSQHRIAIIGAGFSGLTLAWYLQKLGFAVEIFEKQNRLGGVIDTTLEPMMVESAAHAMLANVDVEELFKELNLEICSAGFKSNKKWLFREKPKSWPLNFFPTVKVAVKYLIKRLAANNRPKTDESVSDWCSQVLNQEINDYVLAPGLQGVYGAQSDQLSASLIIGGIFSRDLRARRGQYKGSIAPKLGMQQLIEVLSNHLIQKNVKVNLISDPQLNDLQKIFSGVVVATSCFSAAKFLSSSAPELSHRLSQLDSVSLVTSTIELQSSSRRINGFGCLFPKKERFSSLGVLFNNDIFEGRGPNNNETWIFSENALNFSDSQIIETIKLDRQRLCGEFTSIKNFKVIRWPNVLPLYGFKLENLLLSDVFDNNCEKSDFPHLNVFRNGAKSKESAFPLFLTGNYLGGIGLSKILSYNSRLANRLALEFGVKS
jgi:protoporphyrinogen/coproporphyrinogen III oxidase